MFFISQTNNYFNQFFILTLPVDLSTVANLMYKQFKPTLYTNCSLEEILKSKSFGTQPQTNDVQENFRNVFNNLPMKIY